MTSFPFPTIITPQTQTRVPNQFPLDSSPCPYRLAIIGEAPNESDEEHEIPFVGPVGNFLGAILSDVGIDRYKCFLGNVCQFRPRNNEIGNFQWNGVEIQSGITQLKDDLETFKPNLVFALGNTALHLGRQGNIEPKRKGPKFTWPDKISSWRGSIFASRFFGSKTISSLHPASVLREYSGFPLLKFDSTRVATESRTPELILPVRELLTQLTSNELIRIMDSWSPGIPCSVDIEGGLPNDKVNDGVRADSKRRRYIGWRCVSLSDIPSRGFVIAWWKFNELEQTALVESFARLMWRMDVPKVLQNSLYDKFVLAYGYGIIVRNIRDDVMLKGWEVYSELRKGLSTQASIWTREPHWKDEEMYESTGEALAQGCARDTSVTLEISIAQDSYFSGHSQENPSTLRRLGQAHYIKNLEMLNPLLYMELRGIRYDQENVRKELEKTKIDIALVAEALNIRAGAELRGAKGSLSAKRLADVLYSKLGYPPQFKKEEGRKTEKLTTDVEALLSLRRKMPNDSFLDGILKHRHLEGIIETLSIKPDTDGRVRCGYNVVGTETGRLTCYTSPTGAGANLTTITKSCRPNYTADSYYDFFQCDLEGADGWTVAAHCNRLGDPIMLQDYLAGLKPAKILAMLYTFGGQVNQLDRDSLKFWSDKTNFSLIEETAGWIYFGCKRIFHGTNYLMGIPTMQTLVMKDSFKETGTPVYMDHRDALALQSFDHLRYTGIRTWHSWSESTLRATGRLTSASDHTRIFFGRRYGKEIHETTKEFLADEPQQNTTWATNLAILNLWNDKDNRVGALNSTGLFTCNNTWLPFGEWKGNRNHWLPGSLIIEPLHQVHDALCGQWPQFCREWARKKPKQYFNNSLEIAGQSITIPFDGGFGPSWGDCKEKI